jgi:diguanylate cyclase (GGDEF)-like protein
MRFSSARISLLGRFAAMGVIVLVAVGLATDLVLKQQIERRALDRTVQDATVIAKLGVQPSLKRSDLRFPIPLTRMAELDQEVGKPYFGETGVLRVKLFNRRHRLVYSDDRTIVGKTAVSTEHVNEALAGRAVSELETGVDHDGTGSRTLEVFVPVHVEGSARPLAVLELYVSYEPVAAEIRSDVVAVSMLLGAGLLLLFGTLFRIVAAASRQLRRQALHDALTGLPNRALLQRNAERALRGDGLAAMLLIDLDRFKEVNDTLGHDHGDELLVEVAARLSRAVRRGDTLARLGGDEFAVLVRDAPNRGVVAEVAARLQDALARPFAINGFSAVLDASVGIAYCPDHARDVHVLVQRADVAMYDAKRSRTGIETYAEERDPYSAERLQLLGELRAAISDGQLVLHYQPKIGVGSDEVLGVEALVRWQHPERGLLTPGEFVPLAERTGAIGDLTRWVLDAALAQLRAWRDAGHDLTMAVNLAAPNIVDEALPELVGTLLERWGVPGDRLECEISEHTVMADPVRAINVLERLRALGVRLSLDDFGTGHSSMAYLKRLPLDEVKIDRSFVMGMTDNADDAAIVRSTIDLARNLGLEVVAEGVESEAILRDLGALACDVAQGFFLSRPLPAAELDGWLSARSTRSA